MRKALLGVLGVTAFATMGTQLFAQENQILPGYFAASPWDGGSAAEAIFDAARGSTVPMFNYTEAATKDSKSYSIAMVGTSPFTNRLSGSTINAVIVPLVITIGSSVFDPTAPNTCDSSVAPLARFQSSPLVSNTSFSMNGVNVGNTQWTNAFRRAEFWSTISASNTSAYQNTLNFTAVTGVAVSAGNNGITSGKGCAMIGVVSNSWLDSYIRKTIIPSLTSTGALDPTKLAVFLTANVVQSEGLRPNTNKCCILGYHSATGRPAQTYGVTDWDTSGAFGATVSDASVSSHELAEWFDDPLGNNPTPAWGGVGQVPSGSCQSNLEVGDPLSGTLMPVVTIGGVSYHLQELAFFSWFYNSVGTASLGAGSTFSANGTFGGPSKACPPGGTN